MASIRELKDRIDLHDLAEKLGLERPKGQGNYRSPHHKDSNPSLSIYASGRKWKDHSADIGGDCVALVQHVESLDDVPSAMRRLHEIYGIPFDKPDEPIPQRERTRAEFIAEQCLREPRGAWAYLVGRGITEATLDAAVKARALGYNAWTSPKAAAGEIGHGGPAAAFICRDWHENIVRAVDLRYLDPELNGGLKTSTQGEKLGHPWFLNKQTLAAARTVYVVESAINALCIESAGLAGTAALAIRGTGNARNIDWRMLAGKRVVLALDADPPNDRNERPGDKAAWAIYDALTALDISAMCLDQREWRAAKLGDIAEIAKEKGLDTLREWLRVLEPWCIQGLPGQDPPAGKSRVFLPAHDFAIYWRYRVKEDFTSCVSKVEDTEAGEQMKFEDVAGFRVAAISRVTIQSATSTMSGDEDVQPSTVFAISVQTPRHGARLIRRVLPDDRLHNVDHWKKLGPVFSQARFLRMLTILERSADCGARDAVNFVGLAWRQGKPIVNEGPDCYFAEPEKQCPYHNLTFPSGPASDAAKVITAYQATFADNAAALLLTWSLGAHLKAFIGFWPHMILQADKGAGKSTLVKRLERSIGMTMFGGQSLQTEFRLLTSVSYTSHPVGWEELSARKQEIIDKAVAMLQECYQYTVTRRGSEMTEYLQCAPVLLAGEDVPVRSLTGKVVRADLTGRKGAMLADSLPRFPVREWLQFLATFEREQLTKLLADWEAWLWRGCRARRSDSGAVRMVRNYAAIMVAWALLCEFAGIEQETGKFLAHTREAMNLHIRDTDGDREPWVWICELLISEIESRQFEHPYTIDLVDGEQCLILRPQHVMDHIATTNRLRDHWNSLPVKTGKVFKRQLSNAGVIHKDDMDRRINQRRHAHLSALSLKKMEEFGLYLSVGEPSAEEYRG